MPFSLTVSVLAVLSLISVQADLRTFPAKPIYEPDYKAQVLVADEALWAPNFVIANFAGTRDARAQTDDDKIQSGSVDNGGVDFNYATFTANDWTTISGGQNVSANEAKFTGVYGLSNFNGTGDVFITDYCVIRRVDHQGIITVYAGAYYDTFRQQYYDDIFIQQMGQSCGWNNDVNRLNGMLSFPYGLANDDVGNLYIADTENLRIRVVNRATDMIGTAVGYGHGGLTLATGLQAMDCYIGHVTTVAASGDYLYFIFDDADDITYPNTVDSLWRVNKVTGVVQSLWAGTPTFFLGDFGSVWSSRAFTYFVYYGNGQTGIRQSNQATLVNPIGLGGTIVDYPANQILSLTGDAYGNVYYFMQSSGTGALENVKYCSIYMIKAGDGSYAQTLVAGGPTVKCGPSTIGDPAKESKIMPGYFMTVNKYNDILWAQHYQEAYADKVYYTAGVMSLTLAQPTSVPTRQPSGQPSSRPSTQPSTQPTSRPTTQPSMQPSAQPSTQPTGQPSVQPSMQPSSQPTSRPTTQPTTQPSMQPTGQPTTQPSMQPSAQPSMQPSGQPTTQPSMQPSSQPTMQPSGQPTTQPSTQPTSQPSRQPTGQPSRQPSGQPTGQPSRQPTRQPTGQPSRQPTRQPSAQPTARPTMQPSGQPSSRPTAQPSTQPSMVPTAQPSGVPTSQPSTQPTFMPTNDIVRLTRGEITGAVVGAIVGTFFLCVLVYFGITAYRKAHGIEDVATSSQV